MGEAHLPSSQFQRSKDIERVISKKQTANNSSYVRQRKANKIIIHSCPKTSFFPFFFGKANYGLNFTWTLIKALSEITPTPVQKHKLNNKVKVTIAESILVY